MKKLYLLLIVLFVFGIAACDRGAERTVTTDTVVTEDETLGVGDDTLGADDEVLGTEGEVIDDEPDYFNDWDADTDGFLTRDEWDTGFGENEELGAEIGEADYFDEWDLDRDGRLAEEEYTTGWGTVYGED